MGQPYSGPERRQFLRFDSILPLAYKVCRKDTVSKLLQGYTSDVSQSGFLCKINERVKKGDILWLSFDRTTLEICGVIEKRIFIYQNGIIGKVVRVESQGAQSFNVGVQFITREERNQSNIYPKIHFLKF